MKRLVRKHFLWFYEKMDKDAIDAYAAQASFWILIAFIPFLMFLFTLLQVIRFEDTSLLLRLRMMPSPVEEVVIAYFSEVHAPEGSFR